MSSRRVRLRSTTVPVVLGAVSTALAVVMLVSWILLVVNDPHFSTNIGQNTTVLVLGILSLTVILVVLVLFSVVLVREILESRRQTSFIDSVTHELRSPLASLKLCLQTAERPDLSEDQRRPLFGMMRNDVDRLSRFIDDVLAANRLTHGLLSHEVSAFDLAALAHRCATRVAARHELPEDVFTLDSPATLAVRSDPTVLETVLENLLDNAVKYSDPPPRVTVRLSRTPAGAVHIAVEDEGIGLAPKDAKRIFDRFYRVDSEAVRARRGTGLGLFVVLALVRSLGGGLRAVSDGLGRGTTVHVVLPDASEETT